MRRIAIALLSVAVLGCGEDSTGPESNSPDGVATVEMSPGSVQFDRLGDTVQLTPRPVDQEGNEIATDVAWSSTDPLVATVDSIGRVIGWTPGTAEVRATTQGVTGSASITVDPPPSSGRKIAFGREDGASRHLFIVDVDGSNLRQITTEGWAHQPWDWSPEGRRIAYVRTDSSGESLYWKYIDRSKRFVIVPPFENVIVPDWAPDGKRLTYQTLGVNHVIHFYPPTQARDTIVSDHVNRHQGWGPVWRPDGERLAFASYLTGEFQIYTVAADGSERRQLTDDQNDSASPVYSPEGGQVAYKRTAFRVMDTDGTRDTLLYRPISSTSGDSPQWSASGGSVLVAVGGGVFEVEVRSPNVDTIFPYQSGIRDARWSADEELMAYIVDDGAEAGLWVMNADGTNKRRVVTGDRLYGPVRWQPKN